MTCGTVQQLSRRGETSRRFLRRSAHGRVGAGLQQACKWSASWLARSRDKAIARSCLCNVLHSAEVRRGHNTLFMRSMSSARFTGTASLRVNLRMKRIAPMAMSATPPMTTSVMPLLSAPRRGPYSRSCQLVELERLRNLFRVVWFGRKSRERVHTLRVARSVAHRAGRAHHRSRCTNLLNSPH